MQLDSKFYISEGVAVSVPTRLDRGGWANKKSESRSDVQDLNRAASLPGLHWDSHHKHQYPIVCMQVLGKACNEYTLLYSSIRLCWHTNWGQPVALVTNRLPVKAQGMFWVQRQWPALIPKYHFQEQKKPQNPTKQTTQKSKYSPPNTKSQQHQKIPLFLWNL